MTEVVRRVRLTGCHIVDDEGQTLPGSELFLWLHDDGTVTWDDQVRFDVRPRQSADPRK